MTHYIVKYNGREVIHSNGYKSISARNAILFCGKYISIDQTENKLEIVEIDRTNSIVKRTFTNIEGFEDGHNLFENRMYENLYFENNYIYSDEQEEFLESSSAMWIPSLNSYVNDEYREANLEECNEDGNYYRTSEMREAISRRGRTVYVHRNNLDNYSSCDQCDCLVHQDTIHIVDAGNRYFCPRCFQEYEQENKCINNYSFKPEAEYFKLDSEKTKNTIFSGIEVEVEGNRDNAKLLKGSKYLYCKEDGSLNNGFEIVTHPLSFKWLKKNKSVVSTMLHSMSQNKMKSFQTSTCGIHIHLTKKFFTTLDIFKMLTFFYNEQSFIFIISQRKCREEMDRWASMTSENSSVYERANKSKDRTNSRRYEAINLQNDRTIEFRIFKGSLKLESFYKNIEFCFALASFVKIAGLTEMTKGKFIAYILANKNSYRNLISFLNKKGLI